MLRTKVSFSCTEVVHRAEWEVLFGRSYFVHLQLNSLKWYKSQHYFNQYFSQPQHAISHQYRLLPAFNLFFLAFRSISIDPLFREVLFCLWVFHIARFKEIYTSWSLNAISMKLESQLTWVAKLEIGFSATFFNFESPRHSFPCW